jgi:hypothetical protein
MWTGVGSGPRGSLFRFRFQADCVSVEQIAPARCFGRGPPTRPLFRLGPGHPQHTFSLLGEAGGGRAGGSGGGGAGGGGSGCPLRASCSGCCPLPCCC